LSSNVIHLHTSVKTDDLPDLYPHGGGVEEAAQAWRCNTTDVLDLSTGLHPAGAPTWLGDWLKENASLVGHYPDIHGEPARGALVAAFGVQPEYVLITAGAQALIEVVFEAMGWRSMAIQTPCYNEPIRCAKRAGCEVRAFESGTPPDADMLWLTSPSNPVGSNHWPPSPDTFPLTPRTICLDESYMPFSQRRALGLIKDVIRIGSLTKTFCIPGLRLGYVMLMRQRLSKWQRGCRLGRLPRWRYICCRNYCLKPMNVMSTLLHVAPVCRHCSNMPDGKCALHKHLL